MIDSTGTLGPAAEPWHDRVDYVAADRLAGTEACALLLRPDCYVAWASTSARPGPGPLSAALTRWFGSAERGSGERGSGELGR